MPFRSGLRSGVRGPVYAEAPGATGPRVGDAPRCADATPPAIAVASTARPAATPMAAIGFFILIRESLLRPRGLCQRARSPRRQREAEDQVSAAAAPLTAAGGDCDELFTIDRVHRRRGEDARAGIELPQHLSRTGIERVEIPGDVAAGADEHDAARRDD